MGTVLGSLAAGVIMLYLNYLALGRAGLARTVGVWGTALFLAVILLGTLVPNTAPVALVFVAIQAGIAYFVTERLQGAAIRYHQSQGGAMHSNLRAAMVGFLTALALFFLMVMVMSVVLAVTGGLPQPT